MLRQRTGERREPILAPREVATPDVVAADVDAVRRVRRPLDRGVRRSARCDEVVQRILELRETVGEFATLVYAGHDWADPVLARRSMVLMAEEVMPAVNRALGE